MAKIRPRGSTAAVWASQNPVLAVREYGFETDTRKHKYGDGVSPWNDLPYASAGSALPAGGTTGQVLSKTSNTDGDVQWSPAAGSPFSALGWLNVKDYGAVGDDTANDTTAIQNCINAAFALGVAKIYFPAGVYRVTQLTIPVNAIGTIFGMRVIEFCGVAQPSSLFGTIDNSPLLSNKGSIIKSLSQSVGGSVIKATGSSGDTDFSLVHAVFRDLNIKTYDNPRISALDMGWASQISCYNLQVDTDVFNPMAAEPTTTSATGIITPRQSNGGLTQLKNVAISGYYSGIEANEHCDGDVINVNSCYIGVKFMGALHSILFGRIDAQRCHYPIAFAGSCSFIINCLNIEHLGASQETPQNLWQKTVFDVQDGFSNGKGSINYVVIKGNGGLDNTAFTKNGANGITITAIGGLTTTGDAVYAEGKRVTNQSIPSGTDTQVNFAPTGEVYLQDGIQRLTGEQAAFTVVKSGIYHVIGQLAWQPSATGEFSVLLMRYSTAGGVSFQMGQGRALGGGTENIITTAQAYIAMSAGDKIYMVARQNTGSNKNILALDLDSPTLKIARVCDKTS